MMINKLLALICIGLLLMPVPASAAINAATQWNIRTDGADTNGCAFKAGASGTDFSLQAAAEDSGTDLVIDGATDTIVTSATHNFVAADIGNHIQVTAGTGFTTGFYEIVSTASNAATLDRAVGTLGSTGGTWAMGGACLTIGKPVGSYVAGNTINIKGGNYTSTSTHAAWATAGTATAPVTIAGYTTTPGDTVGTNAAWTGPVITSATNSIILFTMNATAFYTLKNLKMTHTAGTRGICIQAVTAAGTPVRLEHMIFDGCATAYTTNALANVVTIIDSYIANSTGTAVLFNTSNAVPYVIDSFFIDNAGTGALTFTAGLNARVWNSVFKGNQDGIRDTGTTNTTTLLVYGSTFIGNVRGIYSAETTTAPAFINENNVYYNNSTGGIIFDFAGTGADNRVLSNRCNAYGANGANHTGLSAGLYQVTLTADPMTSSTNFAPNNTAGGGAALRGAGCPGAMIDGVTTSYRDIGAVQSQATAGGTRVY